MGSPQLVLELQGKIKSVRQGNALMALVGDFAIKHP
jgi:hypothetical protein